MRAHRSSARAALATTRPFRPAHPFVRSLPLIAALLALATSPAAHAGTYAPHIDEDFPTEVFFGDTHVHSSFSMDANSMGNTRLTPADAYRFARGEEVGLQPFGPDGAPLRHLRLARPLDFAAVTDHAEFLGVLDGCLTEGSDVYDDEACATVRDDPATAFYTVNIFLAAAPEDAALPPLCGDDGAGCAEPTRGVWQEIRDAADAAYDRTAACAFTTLVGYEWSSNPSTFNLHRNVLFRSDVVPDAPIGYFDAPWPDALWAALRRDCRDAGTGCDVLAIPHNPNLSNGLMFAAVGKDGAPIDAAYAAAQGDMEPLVEIMQHKGDSECLPGGVNASDELCGFEKVPYRNLGQAQANLPAEPQAVDYVRSALLEGLGLQVKLGVNPFAFGIIASTDTHLGTPGAVAEAGYPGHGGAGAGNGGSELPVGLTDNPRFNPGGLAAVWAE
ncbi:MAG: DUF3604 domain-containing protein, partial [Myxococcales bacterium]|nr:DUF3604 domain-containing protein [Myxococcales bacterium]